MKCVIALLSLSFCFCLLCSGQALQESSLLKEHFSNDEILELEKISQFFQDQIEEGCQFEDLDSCYHQYTDRVLMTLQKKSVLDYYMSDAEVESLLNELDSSVFNEVFRYSMTTRHAEDGSTTQKKTLDINMQGKYFAFFRDLSSEKQVLVGILRAVETGGDWSPMLDIGFIEEAQLFNYNDPVDRLILAVHYLIANCRYKG